MPADTTATYVIAEAGVNHDGDLARAHALVDIAAAAGADAIKFQLFNPEALVTAAAPTANYQSTNLADTDISQREMLEKLTLPPEAFATLDRYCRSRSIDFLCTPFDRQSLEYLQYNTRMRFLKLASGEVTNGPLLLAAARTGMPIILSTGMSDLTEIGVALSILHAGYMHAEGHPDTLGMPTPAMLAALAPKVTLLHCVSQYPAPLSSMNLRAMETMATSFCLPVGLSDHSLGITMAIAAVARGATMIEKHFTYDVTANGPDHAASLAPDALTAMVAAIREVEVGLGSAEKHCVPVEENTRAVARRSLVAARTIAKGEPFTTENLTCKRPATGPLAPNHLWALLGMPALRDYNTDDFIDAKEVSAR